jgi:hypothetical protein
MARRSFGWLPDAADGRDLSQVDALAGVALDDVEHSDLSAHLPEPSLAQGGTNTCVAHWLAAALVVCESQAGLPKIPPSRRALYYHAARKATPAFLPILDRGCHPRVAVTMLQKLGAPPEPAMPWRSDPISIRLRPNVDQSAEGHSRRGGSYFRISGTGAQKTRDVRRILGLGLPVGIATPVDDYFTENLGPAIVGPQRADRIVGKHMMMLYGHRHSTANLFDYRVLNWWGSGWRDGGSFWMTEEFLRAETTTDLLVVVGWEAIRRRFDRVPQLAAWREVTRSLEEARLNV